VRGKACRAGRENPESADEVIGPSQWEWSDLEKRFRGTTIASRRVGADRSGQNEVSFLWGGGGTLWLMGRVQ